MRETVEGERMVEVVDKADSYCKEEDGNGSQHIDGGQGALLLYLAKSPPLFDEWKRIKVDPFWDIQDERKRKKIYTSDVKKIGGKIQILEKMGICLYLIFDL